MNVYDVMTRDVRIASPDDTLQVAAQHMHENDFGILPVGENAKLIGMLTDRDITIRAVAKGLSPDRTHVRDIMSTEVEYINDDVSIEDAARKMSELQLRRLPVLDRERNVVGIVSLGDLSLSREEVAGEALSSISQPG